MHAQARCAGAFLLKNTRWMVSIPAALYLLRTRDMAMALFLAAAIANACLVKGLKRCIAQPRPASSPQQADYGMPSSHAASLFFFAWGMPDTVLAELSLAALAAAPTTATAASVTIAPVRWMLCSVAAALSLHRVHGKYHTLAQVIVGGAIGTVDAQLWNAHADEARASTLRYGRAAGAGVSSSDCASALVTIALLLAGALAVGSIERSAVKRNADNGVN